MLFAEKPFFQTYHKAGVKHVLPRDAYMSVIAEESMLVDIREWPEIEEVSVDTSRLLIQPVSMIVDSLNSLPRDKSLVLLCAHGERSVDIVHLLINNGFDRVYNLDGGMEAWEDSGLPVVRTGHSCSSCSGCGHAH